MRTGGFPCRLIGCLRTFQVFDQRSMTALHAAFAARTEHELSAHDYHHVELVDLRSPVAIRIKPGGRRPSGS
jgi:hypothetical protein